MKNKLNIKNLQVDIDNVTILKNINLSFQTGDIIALIGPNGAGKSTLLKAIMHHYSTKIKKGDILFNGKSIKKLPTYEIARDGFFYVDQLPPELAGVPMMEFYKNILKINNPNAGVFDIYKTLNTLFDDLSLDKSLLSHGVNVGFSGGQKKKNEIIQSQLLQSKVLLLDEIDAGLDVDAIIKIQDYILKTKNNHITIIITHDLDMFLKVKPTKVVLLANHKVARIGGIELINEVKSQGYKNYEIKKSNKVDAYKF